MKKLRHDHPVLYAVVGIMLALLGIGVIGVIVSVPFLVLLKVDPQVMAVAMTLAIYLVGVMFMAFGFFRADRRRKAKGMPQDGEDVIPPLSIVTKPSILLKRYAGGMLGLLIVISYVCARPFINFKTFIGSIFSLILLFVIVNLCVIVIRILWKLFNKRISQTTYVTKEWEEWRDEHKPHD